MTLTCKHCGTEIIAETEDELVERVQAHVRDHGAPHAVRREAILRMLDKRTTEEDAA